MCGKFTFLQNGRKSIALYRRWNMCVVCHDSHHDSGKRIAIVLVRVLNGNDRCPLEVLVLLGRGGDTHNVVKIL